MAKTIKELNKLKQEYESLSTKLNELTQDELDQVTGGVYIRGLESLAPYASYNTHNGVDIDQQFPSPKIDEPK